ncbi:hypothetical protein DFS34DRAFT_597878 [Phlyctochytrium arcticum]|nr:hypothetical protein DFS34DRAFT_597878 [Phlyctochytrium arcticum]
MNLLDTLPLELILDISEYLDTDDYLSIASIYRLNPVREVCKRLKNEKWAKVTYPVEGNKIEGDKNKKYWHKEIISIELIYHNDRSDDWCSMLYQYTFESYWEEGNICFTVGIGEKEVFG